MSKGEVYVSVDVESNGPIPGPNSMLSFGAVAFSLECKDVRASPSFHRNLVELPDSSGDPATMAWWGRAENAEAWSNCRMEPEDPQTAIVAFVKWVRGLGGHPVFVAYPAGYDFTFMYWYMMKFAKESPFSFSCLDIKTLAMAKLGIPYRQASKKNMPARWFSKSPHTHIALDDAIEQGELFLNIMRDGSS